MNTKIDSRNRRVEQADEISKIYGKTTINDSFLLSLCPKSIIGVSGLKKAAPFFKILFANEKIASFCRSLPKDTNYLFEVHDSQISFKKMNGEEIDFPYQEEAMEAVRKSNVFGGALDQEGNQVIDLMVPSVGPHYAVNLLLGNREGFDHPLQSTPKSVVDAFGGGSFRGEASFQVLATEWGLSPEQNGHPMNRQFYVVEENRPLFYSGHITKHVLKATTTHHPNFTTIEYLLDSELRIKRTIFLLPQKRGLPSATEIQMIRLENLSSTARQLSVVATGMFGSSNPDTQKVDVIYSTVITQNKAYFDEKGKLRCLTPDYYPEYFKREIRFVSFLDNEGYADSFETNYQNFIGRGSVEEPEEIYALPSSLSLKGPNFFALEKRITLQAKEKRTLWEEVGLSNQAGTTGEDYLRHFEQEFDALQAFLKTDKDIEKCLHGVRHSEKKYSAFLQIENYDDPYFVSYVNHTLPFQVRYQTFVSRSFSQTQKGYREIGFREIQDLLASIPYLYAEGKDKLIQSLLKEWIENVYEMGYANHNFFYVGKEPGMCSDDSLWLFQAVKRYIDISGNTSFLFKKFKIARKQKKRTLQETLKAILIYSGKISIGKHGLPLLDSADWNDCLRLDPDYLDGPSKEKAYRKQLRASKEPYGSPFQSSYSESVMNAFLFVVAANHYASLMKMIHWKEEEEFGLALASSMTKNTQENAYIQGYFARVLLNRDNPVHTSYIGSKGDKISIDPDIDGSYYLNNFSWSLLSKVASEEQIRSMLPVVETYLKCPAGYKLCTPENLSLAGAKSSATDHYFPGDRENGGVFKHATMMMTVALLEASKNVHDNQLRERMVDDAFFMVNLVLPYHVLENPSLYKGNPRFCTQYNNSETGENIGPILSGTASWLTLTILSELGFQAEGDCYSFVPALPKESEGIRYHLSIGKMHLHVEITKKKGIVPSPKEAKYYFDGVKITEGKISRDYSGEHSLKIVY